MSEHVLLDGRVDSTRRRVKNMPSFWETVLGPALEKKADDGSVKCGICSKRFKQKNNRNKHYRVVHLRLKPFTCQDCGKSFNQRYVLRNHRESVHLGIKKFQCPVCFMHFADKSNAKKHNRLVHLNEKRFLCEKCGKRFGEKRSLQDHISNVHHTAENLVRGTESLLVA